jgi:hypothetical protein
MKSGIGMKRTGAIIKKIFFSLEVLTSEGMIFRLEMLVNKNNNYYYFIQ